RGCCCCRGRAWGLMTIACDSVSADWASATPCAPMKPTWNPGSNVMARRDFQSIAELEAWLEERGVDLAAWGQGEAKQTADLWSEYASGEAWFQDDPLLRVVEVVQVII